MFYDIVRNKKVTSTSVLADIIFNYDLVVQTIASLALQRLNIPKETIHCTLITLQNMVYSVRTAFGYSNNTYRGYIREIPLKSPP